MATTRLKAKSTGEKMVSLGLRLPESIHKGIQKVAKEELRSVNNQIAVALREWLEQRKKGSDHA